MSIVEKSRFFFALQRAEVELARANEQQRLPFLAVTRHAYVARAAPDALRLPSPLRWLIFPLFINN